MITKENFTVNTIAHWKSTPVEPKKYNVVTETESYAFTDSGVYRKSKFWGPLSNARLWTIKNFDLNNPIEQVGYCEFKDFIKPKMTKIGKK